MNTPEKRVVSFIKKHHVLTLATSFNGIVHTANMFYTYLEEENVFIFTSDANTRHVKESIDNPNVGINIVLESKLIGRLEGLQAEGIIKRAGKDPKFKTAYLKRFPYAAAMPLDLWCIEITKMKLTDNKLGFGKKIIWTKEQ